MSEKGRRDVTEVGRGDFVKVNGHWREIASNTATGEVHPKSWEIRTTDGHVVGMWTAERYAKKGDL